MSLPLRIVDCASESGLAALASRVPKPDEALEKSVAAIIQDVRTRGDEALLEIGQRFDSERLSSIKASDGGDPVEPSIETAYRRIFDFHLRQLEVLTASMQKDGRGWRWQMSPDLLIGQRLLPLQSVGIYAPGGRASYPSTVLMLAGPANAAGVDRVYLATPAAPDGEVDKGVMGAARVAQVSGAFKMGGAAAVAAFAFGTETVPRVDKIVGPGNRFLNEAKRQLWGSIGVDGLYGPSEVCVVVDETSNAAFAAADLLTQIEHAPDNAGFLISVSRSKLEEV
ncbi:MAG TPA: histidinol dehydrogenase, partial [Fimbriimonas sp.]|nr:histidinol dehydrogenase [Fimbriimonas sp.]